MLDPLWALLLEYQLPIAAGLASLMVYGANKLAFFRALGDWTKRAALAASAGIVLVIVRAVGGAPASGLIELITTFLGGGALAATPVALAYKLARKAPANPVAPVNAEPSRTSAFGGIAAIALLMLLTPPSPLAGQAPTVTYTSEGGTRYRVFSVSVDSISTHSEFKEALERASRWSFENGNLPAWVQPIYRVRVNTTPGSARVDTLRRVDTLWISSPADSTIPDTTVTPPPPPTGDQEAPVAVATVQCFPTGECIFDGRGSTDNVGIVRHSWNLNGAGTNRDGDRFEFHVPFGTYTVTLTVTDAAGNSGSASRTFTHGSNQPPPPPPPPPVDTTPTPPAQGLRFIPAERVATWRAMRDANHRLWQEAVNVCGRTGTSNERYGDTGEWCALVAVTDDDAAAAGRAIAKLHGISSTPSDNERREDHVARVLMRDMLDRWMTAADRAAIDLKLTRWAEIAVAINTAQYEGGMRVGDSDLTTGTACGVLLHDLYFGTQFRARSEYQNAITAIGQYVGMAFGGEWIESSEYNSGTVVLLAMCNMAHRTATGSDVVPGTSQFLVDMGTILAHQVTPDLAQAVQWGDEENPRDFLGRLYRRAVALSASPNGHAQWMLEQLFTRHWRFTSAQLMPRALLLANPATAAVPLGDGGAVSPNFGTIYRRQGNALAFATALLNTGVDHTLDFPSFDAQVYRDGEWALTHPIGYGAPDELTVNGPVYAGLALFQQRGPTWTASGNGWSAIAGVVRGQHGVTRWPGPPEFLRYGGRVTVTAIEPSYAVVIVRDSVDMSDPRAASGWPTGWRNEPLYPHQDRITHYEGKFWSLWHMPVQPSVSGATLSWSSPGGQSARLQAFAAQPIQVVTVNEASLGWSGLRPTEIKWHARLHTPAPVLWQVFTVGSATPAVSVSGNTVTVGSKSWTITSAGVVGP